MDAELPGDCNGTEDGASTAPVLRHGADGDVPITARILVVEDDAAINDVVCRRLTREGFSVESAFSGTEAARLLTADSFDLIITDLMLPGLSGKDVVASVRQVDATLPIIVVSARTAFSDKVDLLSLGADDYLTKPFDLDEMAARVRVQLRHRAAFTNPGFFEANPETNVVVQGIITLNPSEHSVLCAGEPLFLTRTEFDMLELLIRHPKRVFTKQALYEHVWGEQYLGQENSVSVHISNLRSKLKNGGADGYIQTVWGLGFKFEVPAHL